MKKISLICLILITFFSCRKDIDSTLTTTTTSPDPTITIIENYSPDIIDVTATIYGIVIDEAGNPMPNAAVILGGNTETTDEDGRFLFKDKTMNKAGTYVEVNKSGFFNGSHRFFPEESSENFVRIALMPLDLAGSFDAAAGGSITTPEGIQIDFPANSVIDAAGNLVTEQVDVAVALISPDAANFMEIMPGGLQGVNESGEEVALASFGMMGVELFNAAGELLNIGNDQNATLTFPVPADMVGNAPAEIPLWSFNETYGIWFVEGSATLVGNNYVGEVSHFSFWNCDIPFPHIILSGTLVSNTGSPVPNASIILSVVGSGNSAAGWTNSDGMFSGAVPIDEAFEMTVNVSYPGCQVYTETIGPFSVDTDLGNIVVDDANLVDITGTVVDCDGDPITSGWIDITLGANEYSYYISDGSDVSLSLYDCDDTPEATVVAGDLENLVVSDPITYTVTNPLDLGNISACGNDLPEYLIITLDGVTSTMTDVTLVIGGPDSTFIWANIPGTDYSVNLGMDEITMTGTYDNDFVQYGNFGLPGATSDWWWLNCGNTTTGQLVSCGFTEIVIDELGTVGEEVIGSFAGEADFMGDNQQIETLPYTATFKIIRQ